MQAILLGAGAGGGFPQWNCGCANCTRARQNDPAARPATQASVAVSAQGKSWLIIGASPDLRQQLLATPELAPPPGTRNPPIGGVVLVSADIDGLAGLFVLRENHAFRLFAPASILKILEENPIFRIMDPALVERVEVRPGVPFDTRLGMILTILEMPGKIPLYQEQRDAASIPVSPTYAARVEADGKVCVAAPGCAELTEQVLASVADADLLFFDGTLFHDNEMIAAGLGWKTGRRMGHVSVSGQDGVLSRLGGLKARKIFFHINNSNPMLLDDSEERKVVTEAGFEVGYDGLRVGL
jgi:pyrroloquinoline quinone biosynthesis protein B